MSTTSMRVHISDNQFQEVVLMGADKPVVVDFWSPQCAPCETLETILDEIQQEYEDRVIIARVNTDENVEWATNYRIEHIPTLLFIAKSKDFDRMIGVPSKSLIKERIEEIISKLPSIHSGGFESHPGQNALPSTSYEDTSQTRPVTSIGSPS